MEVSQLNPAAPPSTRRLVRSIMVVMAGFLLTKGVSLFQAIIIADRFGAGAEYDSFASASLLPDYIVRLIGGGALGVAFIPIFSALLNQDDNPGAWQLASRVMNTILTIAAVISLLVMIFAFPLIKYGVARGLDESSQQAAAEMMRILSVASVLFCISGIISGILHGHNHFFLPALAPVFQDLGLLFGVIFFLDSMGIQGLAWGVLLGALLHVGIQIPGLLMFRFRWQPMLGWRDPTLRRVFRLMLPRMLIGVTFIVDLLVINNINSELGEGAVSAFSWALRFIDIPQALIGTAVGIVIFPTLAALTATNRIDERRAAFSAVIRFILVATIPATAGLLLVSHDMLRLLFDAYDSAIIFTSVQLMGAAIIVQSLHEILTRSFYAEQDTQRPLIFAVIATVVTISVVLLFYAVYQAQDPKPPLWSPLAVGGPALGYVLTFLIEVVLLGAVLRKRWGDLDLPNLMQTTLRTLGAATVMVVGVLLLDVLLRAVGFDAYTGSNILLRVILKVLAGAILFTGAALLLGLKEIRLLPRLIRQRENLEGSVA
jgi:putative peptidoglycan lipid II flippase